MYAIIHSGGKQAKVSEGDIVDVELLKGAGSEVEFTPILVVDGNGTTITDSKILSKATVTAKVVGIEKGPKLDMFKYKNKTGYRRRMGHRQSYTRLEVTSIDVATVAPKAAAEEE